MTLGISVKTIANPLTDEALDALERSGFETFETNPVNFQTPEFDHGLVDKFIAMKRRTGKTSPTFHAPYGGGWDLSALDEDARRQAVAKLVGLFPLATELESRIIVEHPSGEPVRPDERGARIAQLRKSLAELEAPLRAAGFQLALELLPRTCLGNTAAELLAILDGFGPVFGACLDVNHLMGRIRALPDETRLLGGRLLAVGALHAPEVVLPLVRRALLWIDAAVRPEIGEARRRNLLSGSGRTRLRSGGSVGCEGARTA